MSHSRIPRSFVYLGVFCCFLSLLALLLSVALPGVGWVLAALTVITTSLLAPFIGRTFVIVTLILSGIHLFTFGPLSLIGTNGPVQVPTKFLLIFVIIPAAIAILSILISMWKTKKQKSD